MPAGPTHTRLSLRTTSDVTAAVAATPPHIAPRTWPRRSASTTNTTTAAIHGNARATASTVRRRFDRRAKRASDKVTIDDALIGPPAVDVGNCPAVACNA